MGLESLDVVLNWALTLQLGLNAAMSERPTVQLLKI